MMSSRARWFCVAVPVLLVLSGCSAAGNAGTASSTSGGAIELAVSETCAEASNPQCVSVNGENVVLPSAFESAGVANAAVAEGQHAVGVTFDHGGAAVFHTLTKQTAQAGASARLLIKIGDEIQAAVSVPQAMETDQVQIMISPDASAQKVVRKIQGH